MLEKLWPYLFQFLICVPIAFVAFRIGEWLACPDLRKRVTVDVLKPSECDFEAWLGVGKGLSASEVKWVAVCVLRYAARHHPDGFEKTIEEVNRMACQAVTAGES